MKVVVVGAGIGGLVLAHALRRIGVEVRVYERDARPQDTGGYRLHLDPVACDVLRAQLPASVYQALLASSAGARAFTRFSVFDHRLRLLLELPRSGAGDDLLIGRVPLRTLLATGLSDVVRFDTEFTGFSHNEDGTVTVRFADGRSDQADMLVGADGTRSTVVTALTGGPSARSLRVRGLAGRTALDERARQWVPEALASGPAFVVGPDGTGMFLSMFDPATVAVDPRACREVEPIVEPGYVLWGLTTAARSTVDDADRLVGGWSARVRALVRAAGPGSVTSFPYVAVDPDSDFTPWSAGVVTAIGDAVHAMPPTGGRGAATAIRDAGLLATCLRAVVDGSSTIPLAVHTYQRAMPAYARAAVHESLRPLTWQRRLTPAASYALARAAMPAVNTVMRGIRRLTA